MTKTMIRRISCTAILLLLLVQSEARTAKREDTAVGAEEAKRLVAKFGGTVKRLSDYDHDGCEICVRVVSFANTSLTNEDLLCLTEALARIYQQGPVENYNRLDLSFTKVTGEGFRNLAVIPNLTEIDLSSTLVHDEGLRELAYLSHLIDISLDYTYITSTALKEFVRAYSERPLALSLSGATVIEDEAGFGAVPTCPLTTRMSAASLLGILRNLRKVEGLDLSGLGIRDKDLDVLLTGEIKNRLRWIDLSRNSLGKDCPTKVAKLTNLWWLGLKGNTCLNDEHLRDLNQLKDSLEELDLSDTGISNAGLKVLDLHGLTVLDISNTKTILNNEVLRTVLPDIWNSAYPMLSWEFRRDMPNATHEPFRGLEELRLSGTGLSDKDLLDIALLVDLTLLDVSGTLVTDKGLEKFAKYRQSLYPQQPPSPDSTKEPLTIQKAEASQAVKKRIEAITTATITVSPKQPSQRSSPMFMEKVYIARKKQERIKKCREGGKKGCPDKDTPCSNEPSP